ncbi:MAG: hypothetical protein AUG09_06560 [Acidobacteria bacterium 13_1_20CM_2_68_7]|nr:MAG: hypothetical protein AUG09_06560 [Acidobacteria bacterium 13_1_20CM_2_68_7]
MPLRLETQLEPRSLARADVNSDGIDDLIAANRSSNSVSVFLGSSGGSFGPPMNFGSTRFDFRGPSAVVVDDFDEDGHPDIAVALEGSDNLIVLRGSGDGTFEFPDRFGGRAVGDRPRSMLGGDFDGDGREDLVVVNSRSDNIFLLFGNGDASFGDPSLPLTLSTFPDYVAVGDFNADGQDDLAVSYFYGGLSVLLGQGDGKFGPEDLFNVGWNPTFVATGDFNKDGRVDLAVTSSALLSEYDGGFVSPLLGNGVGEFFNPPYHSPAGNYPVSLAVADLDGDGVQDLAVANYGGFDSIPDTVSILHGLGDGTFANKAGFGGITVGDTPVSVAVADVNGDGKKDLAVANAGRFVPGNRSIRGIDLNSWLSGTSTAIRNPIWQ